jgi:phosphate transport system substrate-binding protein
MEHIVMKNLSLVKLPKTISRYNDQGYRNAVNAIGYSLKYFTDMTKTKGVKLLAINGVEPTPENIANGSYPLTQEFYIVARKGDIAPNVQKLIDWFLSEQGQTLIKDVGYVPLKEL